MVLAAIFLLVLFLDSLALQRLGRALSEHAAGAFVKSSDHADAAGIIARTTKV